MALGHTFRGAWVVERIGWPAHNPFQQEVAAANFGLGVAGLSDFGGRGRRRLTMHATATNALTLSLSKKWRERALRLGGSEPSLAAQHYGCAPSWELEHERETLFTEASASDRIPAPAGRNGHPL